ncbi:DnaA inactivator Hda [Paraferrimonas sp. SM1919]|uniref:DnaA inactivator Hda n=1 Tax=Paraferrimonas sp. SM1919 TaxID=2662263 RepID=UPI0013CFECB6|nr:DnaA inactivator Hda [Paraferrimonas sp. SM1919]
MKPVFSSQLSLQVHLPDDETFESYYSAGNDQLISSLRLSAKGQGEACTYLWGAGQSGRTHLLHAACAEATEQGRQTFYLPFSIQASMSPAILEGLENLDLICIDDVDQIAGNPIWEEALFHFYNRVLETGKASLVLTATAPVKEAGFLLPDLKSRLQWGVSYQLQPIADEQKLQALQHRAELRGLQLPEDAGRFLINRLTRDMRTLYDVLDRLDKASLVHKRRLTIPFIKETLHL